MARCAAWRLALCLLVRAEARCEEGQVKVLNGLIDGPVLSLLNMTARRLFPSTAGRCADATDPSLKRCSDMADFPLALSGGGITVNATYITHVDTLRISKLSLVCGPRGVPSEDQEMFFEVSGYFSELAVAVAGHVVAPQVTIDVDAPCTPGKACIFHERDLGFNATGRLACHHHTDSFGIQLDPASMVSFSKPLIVRIGSLKIDFTDKVVSAMNVCANQDCGSFPCPKGLSAVCRMSCGKPPWKLPGRDLAKIEKAGLDEDQLNETKKDLAEITKAGLDADQRNNTGPHARIHLRQQSVPQVCL